MQSRGDDAEEIRSDVFDDVVIVVLLSLGTDPAGEVMRENEEDETSGDDIAAGIGELAAVGMDTGSSG